MITSPPEPILPLQPITESTAEIARIVTTTSTTGATSTATTSQKKIDYKGNAFKERLACDDRYWSSTLVYKRGRRGEETIY
eukprot:6471763-Amphidinium_carterae.1